MLRALAVTLILSSVVLLAAAQKKESERMQNRRALVEMEHRFARAAAEKGTRAGFLEFLADDGIIFQPGPVNGKKFWNERQPRKGLLSWEPEFAEVSRAGDLGYTTGPWEFRPNGPDDKPAAFGEYFTIWKKQSDGSWRVALDRGVSTDKSYATKLLRFPTNDESSTVRAGSDIGAARAILIKLESKFSDLSQAKGTNEAFITYLDDGCRILRENHAPAIGKTAALELVSLRAGASSWWPTAADVSQSNDLGYTYGTFEVSSGGKILDHGSYVRVWKKQDRSWKVVFDVLSPDPQG